MEIMCDIFGRCDAFTLGRRSTFLGATFQVGSFRLGFQAKVLDDARLNHVCMKCQEDEL